MRILSVCLTLVLTGCGTVKIKTAREANADFHAYRTFSFQEPSRKREAASFNEKNRERVREAIERELTNRGLQLSGAPELLVAYYLRVEPRIFDVEHPTVEGGSPGDIMASYYGFYYRSGETIDQDGRAIPYREGTLIVDVVDRARKQLVWRGWAVGAIYLKETDDQIATRIRRAIKKMFHQFPAGAKRLPLRARGDRGKPH